MLGYIYRFQNKVNGKCYIGQTDNIERRYKRHLADYTTKNNKFYAAMRKYGIGSFEFSVIFVAFYVEDLNDLEVLFIAEHDSYNSGYNSTVGGGGMRGFRHSDATISKMKYLKLMNNPQKGKPLTDEHRMKISLALSGDKNHFYGKTHSESSRHKMSLVNKGRFVSIETRLKKSAASSGENNPMFGRVRLDTSENNVRLKGFKVEYLGEVFDSIRAMSTKTGLDRGRIKKMMLEGTVNRLTEHKVSQ